MRTPHPIIQIIITFTIASVALILTGCANPSGSGSGSGETTNSPEANIALVINDGDSSTDSPFVLLNFTTDGNSGGVTAYYVSESSSTPSSNGTGWVSVASTDVFYFTDIPYILSDSSGDKDVYAWLKDSNGNIFVFVSDSIHYDTSGQLLVTSFEDLDASDPGTITPFESTGISYYCISDGFCSKDDDFSNMEVDSRSFSGDKALNATPNGNPSVTALSSVSSALLTEVFDVSGYNTVYFRFRYATSSNPRTEDVHNCDSGVQLLYKLDDGVWQHRMDFCGRHKTEYTGWQYNLTRSNAIEIDVSADSSIQLSLDYTLQNNSTSDPDVFFLIDDIVITAK